MYTWFVERGGTSYVSYSSFMVYHSHSNCRSPIIPPIYMHDICSQYSRKSHTGNIPVIFSVPEGAGSPSAMGPGAGDAIAASGRQHWFHWFRPYTQASLQDGFSVTSSLKATEQITRERAPACRGRGKRIVALKAIVAWCAT